MGLNIFAAGLLIVSFITFAISAGFITDSSRRITGIAEYGSNADLNTAHRYSEIAAIVSWITVALMVVAAVLLFIFASEVLVGFSSVFIYGFLALSIIGTLIVGILAILTAVYINNSKVTNNNGAYKQAIIAAVLATVVFVLVVVAILVRTFYKPKPKTQKIDTEISDLKIKLGEESGIMET